MTYVSKIKFGDTVYQIKDEEARAATTRAMHFIGVTSTALTDLSTTKELTPETQGSLNKTKDFVAGDLVIYNNKEFVWTGSKWSEFGTTGSLRKLAFQDQAQGTVNVVTNTHTHSIGSLSHSVTQGTVSASGNYTPEGTVTITNATIESDMKGENDEYLGPTTNPKKIGAGDKIITNYETENVTIKPVGGTTTVNSVVSAGSVPTYTTKKIPNIISVGSMFTAYINADEEMLTLTPGSVPNLGEDISVNSITNAGSVPITKQVTVATAGTDKTFRAVTFVDWGNSGSTFPTIADAINASFSGNPAVIGVSGSTSGVAVAYHTAGVTGEPSATEYKQVTVS